MKNANQIFIFFVKWSIPIVGRYFIVIIIFVSRNEHSWDKKCTKSKSKKTKQKFINLIEEKYNTFISFALTDELIDIPCCEPFQIFHP